MLHPFTELRPVGDDIGVGVFVTEFIERGTIVWVQDLRDQVVPMPYYAQLPEAQRDVLDKYAFEDSWGNLVLCWDIARYMNHSCAPATLSLGEYCEIAARDLYPGDELTCEYGFLNLDAPMICRCGESNCRAIIERDDYNRFSAQWEQAVRELLPQVSRAAQPLWVLVEALYEDRAIQEAVRRGDPSVLHRDRALS